MDLLRIMQRALNFLRKNGKHLFLKQYTAFKRFWDEILFLFFFPFFSHFSCFSFFLHKGICRNAYICCVRVLSQYYQQKQTPEVFCKKDIPRNFAKFTGKYLRQSLFFNKVAGLPAKFRNFAKFLRTPLLQNAFRRLLL